MKVLKESLLLFLCNPVVICSYAVFCYELVQLCQYGRDGSSIVVLLGYFAILCVLFLWEVVASIECVEFNGLGFLRSRIWLCAAVSFLVLISVGTGIRVYESGTNFGGKLAWVLNRMKNERTIEFVSDNIFEDGLSGIFDDINSKVQLPDVMYLVDEFDLKFDEQGNITRFDLFVYGKNDSNQDASFLIYYNKNRDDLIRVRTNGYGAMDYDEDKLLAPLIETADKIAFFDVSRELLQDEYGVYYEGKQSFSNTTGDVTLLVGEEEEQPDFSLGNLVGYAVSVYIPSEGTDAAPNRYILSKYFEGALEESDQNQVTIEDNMALSYFTSERIGYGLDVVDKALGNSFYVLNQTQDGGLTWEVINSDPFGKAVGAALGIVVVNNQTVFIGASRSGGSYSEIYRSLDGGGTFEKVEFEPYEVKLEDGTILTPFDFPMLPFEENGVLKVFINQGTDGDYLGSSQAMYQSTDNGVTWRFVEVAEGQ